MAELPVDVDLRAYRGDTWAQTFRLLVPGDNGDPPTPLDLDGAVVESWARRLDGSHVELRVTVGVDGEVTIAQPELGMGCGAWEYDVEVTLPDTSVTTWIKGELVVEDDVTNA